MPSKNTIWERGQNSCFQMLCSRPYQWEQRDEHISVGALKSGINCNRDEVEETRNRVPEIIKKPD